MLAQWYGAYDPMQTQLMDVLNLIALFSHEQYESLKRMDPTYLIISNNDGKFNGTYAPAKDNKLALYLLNNNLGETVEYELED